MIRGVTARDPPDRVVLLAVGGEAGAVHDLASDLRPFVIGEVLVVRGGPDEAVPYGAARSARAEGVVWLSEQAGCAPCWGMRPCALTTSGPRSAAARPAGPTS